MARWVLALLLTLASSPLLAQDGLRSASLPERDPMNPVPPSPGDLFVAPPDAFRPHPMPQPPLFVVGGYWPWGWPEAQRFARRAHVATTGTLELQVQPVTAHVYIDGLYVGNVNDIRRTGPGRTLDGGAHHVDIRADGYQPLTFDVRIEPNQTTTYRDEMMPVTQTPPASRLVAPSPAAAKVFYVIPGCYAGDRRPTADKLPSGCSLARLRAIPPTVSRISSRAAG